MRFRRGMLHGAKAFVVVENHGIRAWGRAKRQDRASPMNNDDKGACLTPRPVLCEASRCEFLMPCKEILDRGPCARQ